MIIRDENKLLEHKDKKVIIVEQSLIDFHSDNEKVVHFILNNDDYIILPINKFNPLEKYKGIFENPKRGYVYIYT